MLKKLLLSTISLMIFVSGLTTASALSQSTVKSVVLLEVLDSKNEVYYGTGVIISVDGFILTAAHVIIDEATGKPIDYVNICQIQSEYTIPQCQYSGRVAAYDEDYDLALITIGYALDENLEETGEYIGPDNSEALNLPYADFGDFLPNLGDNVAILGFPGTSASITLTKGVISSFELLTEDLIGNYITDAIINPGNSGGPAYNSDEKVIGIVTAVTTEEIGGNYGLITSTNKILFWFLELVDQGILNQEFVDEIFTNDQIESVAEEETITTTDSNQIFNDVNSNSPNAEAIDFLKQYDIVKGYEDGSFKPNNPLNRAELLKILVEGAGHSPDENVYKNCFPDVKTDWYAKYVCFAKESGWINGYPDNTFRPGNNINKVEAMKMLLEIFDVDLETPNGNPYADVDETQWYGKYVYTAKVGGLLEEEGSKYYPAENITRGQISENIFRLLQTVERAKFIIASKEGLCEMLKLLKREPESTFEELNAKDVTVSIKYGFDVNNQEYINYLYEKYSDDPEYKAAGQEAISECGSEELFTQLTEILQTGLSGS